MAIVTYGVLLFVPYQPSVSRIAARYRELLNCQMVYNVRVPVSTIRNDRRWNSDGPGFVKGF